MTSMESRNHARSYLQKAQEYLDSAQDSLDLERPTPAAGETIHAGISAKDAIVTGLTGETSKAKDHAKAAKELCQTLGAHSDAATAENALRELISMKGDVESGTTLITLAKAKPLVRRAELLVDLAKELVRRGQRVRRCTDTLPMSRRPMAAPGLGSRSVIVSTLAVGRSEHHLVARVARLRRIEPHSSRPRAPTQSAELALREQRGLTARRPSAFLLGWKRRRNKPPTRAARQESWE